jgi:hypothetical protein
MAKTLANIQKGARYYARNDQLVITNGHGLTAVNAIYRGVSNALPWPELRKTMALNDGSAVTMVTDQAAYQWIFEAGDTTVFMDVKGVEVETGTATSVFNLLVPPPTESEWNESAKDTSNIPAYYLRFKDGSTNKVELRPVPSSTQNGGDIRVIGIIEPTELTVEGSETIFLVSTADDVIEYLVAADDLILRGITDKAEVMFSKATKALRKIFNDELVPEELVKEIVA